MNDGDWLDGYLALEEPVLAWALDAFGALVVFTASRVLLFRTIHDLERFHFRQLKAQQYWEP